MFVRSMLVTALLAAVSSAALAQENEDVIAVPVLRAQVTVEGDIVRIGDMVENAGSASQIAIYRSPDLGTTGTLPTAQVHQHASGASGDRRRYKGHQIGRGHATGAHPGRQGDRIPGCARARASQRAWRCGQPQPDIRSRCAGRPAGGLEQRLAAARPPRVTSRAAGGSTSLSRSPTIPTTAAPNCVSPALPSKCWRPRF